MDLNNSLRKTPIAVIGLSAIFADARNIEEFWTNIVQAKDSITDVPGNRWKIEDYYDADMTAPDKTYCKRGGFLPEVDFNPLEFGLPPNILEVTDASQLLGLVAARDALEDAGYGKTSDKFTTELKAKTGVLLGVGGGQKLITPLIARLQYPIWEKALRSSGIAEDDIPPIIDKMKKAYVGWNENSFPGLLGNVISGRITNRFDLGGINSVVDAACAASLSAIKMALSELVEGRCDMMLTGGVDTDNSPFMYMSFSKTPAFSKSGNISPFSAKADGMLIGEGLGMLVLKRLADAERDGDQIYSVIKGVGTSSDGRFKSVYAPRSSGQALAMNRTYEEAGYAPATVGLLEAHGTGTGAGDPTEFESMQMVFGTDNPQKQHIALGSVKSQVGHTKAAAGAAGMIKAVMALHHKVLPATINVEQPNPKFDIENSAIYINTETRPWLKTDHPRRASVSAFGFGGINVHIAMEEYKAKHEQAYRIHQPNKAILLKGATPEALLQTCQQSIEDLKSDQGETTFLTLVENSKEFQVNPNEARLGFVATSLSECIDLLQVSTKILQSQTTAWDHPKGIYYRPASLPTSRKVVALFSGQGSQYVGMGKEAAISFPQLMETFQQSDAIFAADQSQSLSSIVFPKPVFNKEDQQGLQNELTKTQNAQPAIGTLSMGLYKIFQNAGFKADCTAGHSFGELTALWAAGVYDDATFIALAKARGNAMASTKPGADAGAMLAVKAPVEQVEAEIKTMEGISIANVNSTSQVVLGGSSAAIAQAQVDLKSKGFKVVALPVSAAFHTTFVKHAQEPFAQFIAAQKFKSAKIPVYSNTTGKPYPKTANPIKNNLQSQILNPVLFKNEIENIYADGGNVFVEFGPKGVLTNLVKDILKGKEFEAIAVNANAKKDSDLQLRQAFVQLQVLGLSLQNIDPYKAGTRWPQAQTKLNVKLSGNNYVSTGTQKAYTDVMNNGFQVKSNGKTIIKEVEKIVEVEKIIEVEKLIEAPVNSISHQNQEEETMSPEQVKLLNATLEHLKNQQAKTLELFDRIMSEQQQQSQSLLNILGQQFDGKVQTPAPIRNGQNGATSNGHNGNGKVATNLVNTVSSTITSEVLDIPQPIQKVAVQTPSTTPSSNGNGKVATDTKTLENILLTVVSEKTGYPTEMLELSMDMEADLGIDSIKRVEIFGAMTENHPEVSGINPQELTELRTLGQIVDYLAQKGGASVAAKVETTVVSQPIPTAVVATPTPSSNGNGKVATDTKALENILLTVVSEKTGYPTEMLELSMDMEADLGIDSIKRVEIFGAMTENHPEVSGINPQELTELRTLGQIVDYLAQKGGANIAANTTTATPSAQPLAVPVPATTVSTTPATSNGNGLDTKALENILLTVVSEKTGYPTEMLELSMDMEADLGIDSIKRVEIFGHMTENYPQVSGINPQELTELRTLGQIVDYLVQKGGASAATTTTSTPAPIAQPAVATTSTPASSNGNDLDTKALENILLTVVSEKTGYPTEMLELSMDMEADLGIDSIKRVEIFGAMTENYPEVSGINPQELTELRTLGQIVQYLDSKKKVMA